MFKKQLLNEEEPKIEIVKPVVNDHRFHDDYYYDDDDTTIVREEVCLNCKSRNKVWLGPCSSCEIEVCEKCGVENVDLQIVFCKICNKSLTKLEKFHQVATGFQDDFIKKIQKTGIKFRISHDNITDGTAIELRLEGVPIWINIDYNNVSIMDFKSTDDLIKFLNAVNSKVVK